MLGYFTGGGDGQISSDYQNHYELQNYTSVIHGSHTLKFGGRLRMLREQNTSNAGYNGSFTFSSLTEYQAAECALLTPPLPAVCAGLPPATPQLLSITQPGPGTSAAASLLANVNLNDVGLYVQDDWKVRSNITFSYGFRYETQDRIRDHADLAPRLGLAWGVGRKGNPPFVVIRGGVGLFYDRFQSAQLLQAERLNGITQQQIIIDNPTCFPGLNQPITTPIANCGTPSTTGSAIYQVSPSVTAPYTLQSAISVERQLTKSATLTVTYLNSRGSDQLLSINSTAPYPGTPCAPNCVTPSQNVYQYVSEGVFRQNQIIANTNIRAGTKIQLFGYYVLNYANSDAAGVGSFASNSYNISQDYGRASFDTRQRLFAGGSVALPHGIRLSPFMILSSGTPFNITTGTDLNGDSIFNDRPAFAPAGATCGAPIYCTSLGNFNAMPAPGQRIIPINYGTGPSHETLNLRIGKTFGFGPSVKGGGGNQGGNRGGGGGRGGPLFGGGGPMNMGPSSDHRYNLTLSASARNVFNKVNLGNPGGVLGSPFFDTPNGLQGGPFSQGVAVRRIDLQAAFSF